MNRSSLMSIKGGLIALLLAGTAPAALAQEGTANAPLSAIDWLSDSVANRPAPAPIDPPVTGVTDTPITVTPLDGPDVNAVGLLSVAVTGLPKNLWGTSEATEIARLIRRERVDTLPALQALLYTILLAEVAPPTSPDPDKVVFLARLDKLLELGALDQAQALLERAGPTDPDLFRRWFDVSLLTGHEDHACAAMLATPEIAPTFPARIFCLARDGDWNAAALTLETGTALGFISDTMEPLLLRFLEPEFADPEDPLPFPVRPSPLVFRMMEAIGQPMSTTGLPRAFAVADLRSNSGWKAQIEAAERLARASAISPNRLLGVMTAGRPAASGGVWDRVAAIQAFDVALLSRDADMIAKALPPAWAAARKAEIERPFAELYAARLWDAPLTDDIKSLAFQIGMLSPDYETIAAGHTPAGPRGRTLIAIARGFIPEDLKASGITDAVLAAFRTPEINEAMRQRLNNGQVGEAILLAIDLVTDGARGDLDDITQGLAVLRQLGLEDAARRAALELLILERRG